MEFYRSCALNVVCFHYEINYINETNRINLIYNISKDRREKYPNYSLSHAFIYFYLFAFFHNRAPSRRFLTLTRLLITFQQAIQCVLSSLTSNFNSLEVLIYLINRMIIHFLIAKKYFLYFDVPELTEGIKWFWNIYCYDTNVEIY